MSLDLFQCHANRFTHLFKISVISVEILNHISYSGLTINCDRILAVNSIH